MDRRDGRRRARGGREQDRGQIGARVCDGPRERIGRDGLGALSDAELIALVVRTGAGGMDALALARKALGRWGGLRGLARATQDELASLPGVGPAKASAVVAAFELGRRWIGRRIEPGAPIGGPVDVHRHFHAKLADVQQEHFLAVLLDGRHRVIEEVTISRGTLTASLVHPREVFRRAIRAAAAAIVLVHNHPSGDPTPSREDEAVTGRLQRAGTLLGVQVLDHVVVAEQGWFSFREGGLLEDGSRDPT